MLKVSIIVIGYVVANQIITEKVENFGQKIIWSIQNHIVNLHHQINKHSFLINKLLN